MVSGAISRLNHYRCSYTSEEVLQGNTRKPPECDRFFIVVRLGTVQCRVSIKMVTTLVACVIVKLRIDNSRSTLNNGDSTTCSRHIEHMAMPASGSSHIAGQVRERQVVL